MFINMVFIRIDDRRVGFSIEHFSCHIQGVFRQNVIVVGQNDPIARRDCKRIVAGGRDPTVHGPENRLDASVLTRRLFDDWTNMRGCRRIVDNTQLPIWV